MAPFRWDIREAKCIIRAKTDCGREWETKITDCKYAEWDIAKEYDSARTKIKD